MANSVTRAGNITISVSVMEFQLPLVSLTLEPRRHFHFRLETVTMVRYNLSIVVTDQKHDEQFFHEEGHV